MGFKTGLIIGMGIGYVLGTRSGRERYEELRGRFNRLASTPRVRDAAERARVVAAQRLPEPLARRIPGASDGPRGTATTQIP